MANSIPVSPNWRNRAGCPDAEIAIPEVAEFLLYLAPPI